MLRRRGNSHLHFTAATTGIRPFMDIGCLCGWCAMLEGILSALPVDDPRRPALSAAAQSHRRAGIAAVTGEHYEGGHWLGSFAVYLTTQRGIQHAK